jgi:hypothetical protein
MIFGGAAKRYEKLKKTSSDFLRDSHSSLLKWDAKHAFLDMSSEIRRVTEDSLVGGKWSHAKGTIRSLKNRGNKWLAFTLNIRNGNGQIDLHSSSNHFSLEYVDRLGTFRVDGAIFGYIDTDGEIMNTDQLPIGRVRYRRSFTPMGLSHITPVDIDGRTIAEIYYLTDFGDRLWKAPALVQGIVIDMSNDETIWIIAVIAMRLYSHCRTSKVV